VRKTFGIAFANGVEAEILGPAGARRFPFAANRGWP
jgi:hypothetical protein